MFAVAHEFFPPGGGKIRPCSTLFGLNVISEGASSMSTCVHLSVCPSTGHPSCPFGNWSWSGGSVSAASGQSSRLERCWPETLEYSSPRSATAAVLSWEADLKWCHVLPFLLLHISPGPPWACLLAGELYWTKEVLRFKSHIYINLTLFRRSIFPSIIPGFALQKQVFQAPVVMKCLMLNVPKSINVTHLQVSGSKVKQWWHCLYCGCCFSLTRININADEC